jgi:transposase-like protein
VNRFMSALTRQLADVIEPLNDDEQRRAVEAGLAHVELRRPIVYGAELRIDKRRRGLPGRQVGVLLADLDGYTVYEVTVADDGSVVSAAEQPDLVPPFSDEEVAEAAVLARSDERVAEVARGWGIRSGTFYPSQHRHDGHDGEHVHRRLVGLHFLDTADAANVVPLVSAVVDLTTGEVVSVERHEAAA